MSTRLITSTRINIFECFFYFRTLTCMQHCTASILYVQFIHTCSLSLLLSSCLGAFCEHVLICGFTAMKEKWKETALKCSTVSVVSGRWRKSELCGACLRVSLMIVYIPKLGMHRYIGQTSAQPDLGLVDHSLLCKQECIY